MFPVGFGFGAIIGAGCALLDPGGASTSIPWFFSCQNSIQSLACLIIPFLISAGGSGISRLSICGGIGACGAAIGAVTNSDNRVLGGSMGGNPPYPTGRLRLPVNCPGRKLVPILMFLTFLSPPPSLGANLGHVPAPRRPGSPKSIPPEIKWYSLLRGVVGWSHVFKGIASKWTPTL